MKALVFHNTRRDGFGRNGYSAGDPLTLVAEMEVGGDTPEAAAERVFYLANVGDDPTFGTPNPQAVAYRERRNRSLSVGDVVEVEGVMLAVGSYGFSRAVVDPEQVTNATQHGTTPLEI